MQSTTYNGSRAQANYPTEADSNTPLREVNILLLGETGVGKSTWINAIANYLTYDTLEDAIASDIVVLIPSQFSMTNDNYEEIKVTVGNSDPNEVHSAGQSATQHPTSYTFQTRDLLVRIIDTPGIGDTRGIQQDKENFQRIMNHLSHVDVIHGICVLLKPNSSRISISFEFCIKELLTQLHRDSAQNIAFCFTNARSTFYRPGDTLGSLKALLTNNNQTPTLIPLEKRTIYCLDNEAFRFLAAVKHGETFDDEEQQNFANSWKTSVKETGRMLEYFQSLTPHATKNTVTLNATRQIILKLAKPLAEVSQNIQTNIALLDDKAKEINNLRSRGQDLRGKMKIPQVDLKSKELDYPKTVCADPTCTEKISVHTTSEEREIFKTDYKQVCHDHCYLEGVATNQLECAQLQGCAAMTNGTCHECHHGWEKHMHITYDIERVMVDVIDKNVQANLQKTEDQIEAAEAIINQCNQRRRDYEMEQKIITKTAAKFAVFLKENSITPYNNAIIRYLDYMIELEDEKVHLGGMKTTVDQLRKLRAVYVEEENILIDAMNKSKGKNISLDDIQDSLKALYSLPLTGPTIWNLLEMAKGGDELTYTEKAWKPKSNQQGASNGLYSKFSNLKNRVLGRNAHQ